MAYERRPVRKVCSTPERMGDRHVRDRSLFSRVLRMCLRRLCASFLLICQEVRAICKTYSQLV
jgi:hypothetical protein